MISYTLVLLLSLGIQILEIPICQKNSNPAGAPGYRNGTESFFDLKGRPSVVRDA